MVCSTSVPPTPARGTTLSFHFEAPASVGEHAGRNWSCAGHHGARRIAFWLLHVEWFVNGAGRRVFHAAPRFSTAPTGAQS